MENYIKDRFEEFKSDGIICTKKEKYYLITLEQKQNSKKWLFDNFNKLNGNEIDQGMIKHLEIFSEVGEKAYREAKFEEKLKGIEMKWKEIFFALTENKLTHLSTIENWNEINKEFDTDIMNLQKLDLSPFKGLITEQISKWNILLISSVLEEWIKCQKSWIYFNEYLTVEI